MFLKLYIRANGACETPNQSFVQQRKTIIDISGVTQAQIIMNDKGEEIGTSVKLSDGTILSFEVSQLTFDEFTNVLSSENSVSDQCNLVGKEHEIIIHEPVTTLPTGMDLVRDLETDGTESMETSFSEKTEKKSI